MTQKDFDDYFEKEDVEYKETERECPECGSNLEERHFDCLADFVCHSCEKAWIPEKIVGDKR